MKKIIQFAVKKKRVHGDIGTHAESMAEPNVFLHCLSGEIFGSHPRVKGRAAEINGIRPAFNGRGKRCGGSGGAE